MAFNNIKIGTSSLQNITTGDGNITIGDESGINLTTESNNIYIGHSTNPTPQNNQLIIQQNGATLLSGDFSTGQVKLGSNGYLNLSDIGTPSNPGDGQGRIYKKTGNDGIFWLPDAGGVEVDLTAVGGTMTLQEAYNASTTPEFTLDSTRGAITIQDNSTPIGANLLEIQNNTGDTTYMGVTDTGISVSGNIAVTGTVDSVDISTLNNEFSAHTSETSDPHGTTLTQTNINTTTTNVSTGMSVDTITEYTNATGTFVDGVKMLDSFIELSEISTPSTIPTNQGRFYYGTDNKPHFIADDDDIETDYDLASVSGVTSIGTGTPGEQTASSGLTFSSNPLDAGTISLSNVNITAGSYHNSDITVDQTGRIVDITSGKISSANISGGTPDTETGTSGLTVDVGGSTITDYTTTGSTSWQVPVGVTSISVVCVGGGGGGGGLANTNQVSSCGGGGGGLTHLPSIVVTSGETLDIIVGSGGTGGPQLSGSLGDGIKGGSSGIQRSAAYIVEGQGGDGGGGGGASPRAAGAGGLGGVSLGYGAGSGGNGGDGGGRGQYNNGGGGGGGTGGYSGTGGTGGISNNGVGTSGSGGGGGGGGGVQSSNTNAAGGGVGLGGEGANGAGGATNNSGTPGSGGVGQSYGGGGSGREDDSLGTGFPGADGAVRITYTMSGKTVSMYLGIADGTYTAAGITVNQNGIITAAVNGFTPIISGSGINNQIARWVGTSNIQGSAVSIDDFGNFVSSGGTLTLGSASNTDALVRFRSNKDITVWIDADTGGNDIGNTADFVITQDDTVANFSIGLTGDKIGFEPNAGYIASGTGFSEGIIIAITANSSSVANPPIPSSWDTLSTSMMSFRINTGEIEIVFGEQQSPFSGDGLYKFTGETTNQSTGPHIEMFSDIDEYATFQLYEWDNNNQALVFDSYYNGNLYSSDTGSNYLIHKINNQVLFNYGTGITAGSTFTPTTALTLDFDNEFSLVGTSGLAFTNTENTSNSLSYYNRADHSTTFSSTGSTTTTSPIWNIIRIGAFVQIECTGSPEDTSPENDIYVSDTSLPIAFHPTYIAEQVIVLTNPTYILSILQVTTSGVINFINHDAINTGLAATWQSPQVSYIA